MGADHWDVVNDSGNGDCEDYVLTKAQQLISTGWNPNDLRVGVLKYRNTFHAVLVATIGDKSYFLDNNANEVKPVNRFPGNGMSWYLIQIPGSVNFTTFNGTEI